ncbi:FxsA family protein [Sneathiella limimaris]|uniref:FxsA family protein n=1 Tax=Sneathiella limimaris TaxID=1964213 RepID=UPI0019CFAA98|nr:FxsA family protein [Sneathiella limimaris]
MPLLFFALLIGIPVVEIAVFIEIGGEIGAFNTIGLTILTAIIGMALLRYQGISVLTQAQARLNAGESPVREIFSGIMLALAGLFLLIPGFVTDTIGFLLFLPPLRSLIANQLASSSRFVRSETVFSHHSDGQYRSEPIIEGEYHVVEDADDLESGPKDPNSSSPWSKNKDD